MPKVTVCVWSCQSPAQMFLGYNSKRTQDVPGCDFEKIRRLNENMLGMKLILKLINEDKELREEVRLPPGWSRYPRCGSCANGIGKNEENLNVGGRPVHLSGLSRCEPFRSKKILITYIHVLILPYVHQIKVR